MSAPNNMHNLTTLIKRYVSPWQLGSPASYIVVAIRFTEMVAVVFSAAASARCANLIARLEAATSRLEDIATSTELPGKDVPALVQPSLAGTGSAPNPTATPKSPTEELPESIEDFDTLLNGPVAKYAKLSSELGGLVAKQASQWVMHKHKDECPTNIALVGYLGCQRIPGTTQVSTDCQHGQEA